MLVNYQGWLRLQKKEDSRASLSEFLYLCGVGIINSRNITTYVWYSRFALEYRLEV